MGDELSNLFAGSKPAVIRGEDAMINRGDGVIVQLDFVGANDGIRGSGFSHALMVAPNESKHHRNTRLPRNSQHRESEKHPFSKKPSADEAWRGSSQVFGAHNDFGRAAESPPSIHR